VVYNFVTGERTIIVITSVEIVAQILSCSQHWSKILSAIDC